MSQVNSLVHSGIGWFVNHIGAIIAVLFWGMSFVSTKVIMVDGGLSPTEAYIYRFVIAYLILLAINHKHIMARSLRDEGLLLLCGMTAGSIYFIAENTALSLTYTTNVSLLSSTSPLVTLLLVGIIYKSERPGLGIIAGSVIAFVGVICVIFNSISPSEGVSIAGNPLGDILSLAVAFSWAIYSLILKRLNVIYDAMFITRKTFFYGLLTALPFLALEPTLVNPISVLSKPIVIGNILFLALGASIASFYFWALTVDKLGAVKANNYMYLQPIVTLIASWIILGEKVTMLGYAGLALVLFGLWFGDYLQARLTRRSR